MLPCDSVVQDHHEVSVIHVVLPPLAITIVKGGDAGAIGDHIIDSLWNIFDRVRETYQAFSDQKVAPTFLIWAWPGEESDRPSDPTKSVSVPSEEDEPLSLLPALSALLRCMALELECSITLISTDAEPEPTELLDLISFLHGQAVQIGDVILSNHRLSSFEPRLSSSLNETNSGVVSNVFDSHVLSLGGARGIVAEILTRLTTDQTHLSLVGRTSADQPNSDFQGLTPQEMMRLLMNKNSEAGNSFLNTPKSLQLQVDQIQRQYALQAHLKNLSEGVKDFDYHSADLSDPDGLSSLLEDESMLDIEVLISGAGVIKDQSCLTKTRDSFEAVLRTKVIPLCVLLCNGMPSSINTWISFSSIASKSGNAGQTDYAAANEFLNTVVHWFSRRHPGKCLRTINWGPWEGSGMASKEVLEAFQSRGLEAINPEDAASMLQGILAPECGAVEVSGVALDSSVTPRLRQQQSLMDSSPLWNHHTVPVQDALASDEWRLFFHDSVPYLSGHKKNGRAVVPAALVLCLAADLVSSLEQVQSQVIHLHLYVFHGITIPPHECVNIFAKSKTENSGQSGEILLRPFNQNRPHYKVNWNCDHMDSGVANHHWQFDPQPDNGSLLCCSIEDVYSTCLFHSHVMARLSGSVMMNRASDTAWCNAQATPIQDQLGIESSIDFQLLPNRDLTLVDSLLQLLLVQLIEIHHIGGLPQELFITMFGPMPTSGEVKLATKILDVQGPQAVGIGACCDSNGNIVFEMAPSKFTVSKDLLDHPPGISREQRVNS